MLTPTLNLPTITQEVALNTIRFNRAFTEFENRISAFGHRMTNLGIATSLALSIPMQVIGGVLTKRFVDLDEAVTAAFSKIQGAGKGVKQALWEAADSMSRVTSTSSVDLAGGLKELIASGYSARDAIAALDTVNKFAIAGEQDMTKATGTLITVMSSLGLRTGDTAKDMETMRSIASVLVKAADATRVGVEEFATALSHKALTAMKTVNMSLEEGVAILMAYAQRGIEGARAGEYLNVMLRDLQTIALKNSDTWRAWGLEVYDTTGKLKPVADILGMLEQRFAGASDEQLRMSLTQLKFKDKSIAATLALIGASKEVQNFTNVLRGAGTILDDTYKVRMESLKNQFGITRNIIASVGQSIMTTMAPALIGLNQWIRQTATAWFAMSEQHKKVTIGFMVFTAILGPSLILLGAVIRSVGVLGQVFYYLSSAVLQAAYNVLAFTIVHGAQFVMSLIRGIGFLWQTYRMFGLMATMLQVLQLAHIRTAVTAIAAWLAELGPIALLVIAIDSLIYKITGKDGVMWAFEGLKALGQKVLAGVNEIGKEAMDQLGSSMEGAMDAMIKKMESFGEATNNVTNGVTQLRAALAATASVGGFATGIGALGAGGALGALAGNPMSDMGGFDQADFKKMMDDAKNEFDASLLGGEEKKKGGDHAREGYSGVQYGTAEEYKARVGGYDNQMMRIAQQQLNATTRTNQKVADAAEILKRIESQGAKAPRLKASNLF